MVKRRDPKNKGHKSQNHKETLSVRADDHNSKTTQNLGKPRTTTHKAKFSSDRVIECWVAAE